MDFYLHKVWNKGCKYIVAYPNQVCNKCGEQHNQTAEEAGHALFPAKEPKDGETTD